MPARFEATDVQMIGSESGWLLNVLTIEKVLPADDGLSPGTKASGSIEAVTRKPRLAGLSANSRSWTVTFRVPSVEPLELVTV